MAVLSLRDAAEQTGVSKSTIFRAIKAGRMSAPRDDAGNFAIDPAELFRVYAPKAATSENPTMPRDVPAQAEMRSEGCDAPGPEAVELRVRNASLEAQVDGLKAMVEELRAARDQWQQQAERTTLALAKPEAPQPVAPAPPRGASWWPFRRTA